MGSHVKFTRFVFLPLSEEAKTTSIFFFRSMYNKELLELVFVIYKIIKVLVRVISVSLQL